MQPLAILLVEDDPVIALGLKTTLELDGFKVLCAGSPAEAIRLCDEHLPDIAILNFHRKHEMDGMALARLLRTRYLAATLLATGARPQDIARSADFYAGQEVLFKPFTRRQLQEAIGRLVIQIGPPT
ncbi:MAG: response regulator [Lewinellaceae bacterium]|nr:response regulator [Lewinellaceae bacterium]